MKFLNKIFEDSIVKSSSLLDEIKKSILVDSEEEYNRMKEMIDIKMIIKSDLGI